METQKERPGKFLAVYNLPKVVQAVKGGKTIFVVEGEKDADLLNSMGLVATTNYEGVSKDKFKKQYVKYFTEANVVVNTGQ